MTQNGGDAPCLSSPTVMSSSVITPIVFWASPVPCASETSDAEIVWPCRKVVSTDFLRARCVSL